MSAYGHQMEREYSARSLSSRGGSEMESRYMIESGFYMTSFAATIFIGSLLTVGVLLITLLISLTVMLQSCQSSSKAVIEMQNPNEDYNYCKMFLLHAEYNNLEPDDFPSICRSPAFKQIYKDHYVNDLNTSLWVVHRYFDSAVTLDDGLEVVLIDIDDILPDPDHTPLLAHRSYQHGGSNCFEEFRHLKHALLLKLYMKVKASGWSLVLLSRKPEMERNSTMLHLLSAGYSGWSSLILRLDYETGLDSREYISRRKDGLQKSGFRISGVISSRMDALTSSYSGERIFKLPNEKYYHFDHAQETHTIQNLYGSMHVK